MAVINKIDNENNNYNNNNNKNNHCAQQVFLTTFLCCEEGKAGQISKQYPFAFLYSLQ